MLRVSSHRVHGHRQQQQALPAGESSPHAREAFAALRPCGVLGPRHGPTSKIQPALSKAGLPGTHAGRLGREKTRIPCGGWTHSHATRGFDGLDDGAMLRGVVGGSREGPPCDASAGRPQHIFNEHFAWSRRAEGKRGNRSDAVKRAGTLLTPPPSTFTPRHSSHKPSEGNRRGRLSEARHQRSPHEVRGRGCVGRGVPGWDTVRHLAPRANPRRRS